MLQLVVLRLTFVCAYRLSCDIQNVNKEIASLTEDMNIDLCRKKKKRKEKTYNVAIFVILSFYVNKRIN